MTYPDDVMRAAREAVADAKGLAGSDRWVWLQGVNDRRPEVQAAARAIMAERERAAKVAEEFRRGAGDPVCAQVAAAIRKGE